MQPLLCLHVSKTATPVQDSNLGHLYPPPPVVCLFVLFVTVTQVYIIHRFDYLEASKVMQRRVLNNPKIEVGVHVCVCMCVGCGAVGVCRQTG